jgi:hypothetical protein
MDLQEVSRSELEHIEGGDGKPDGGVDCGKACKDGSKTDKAKCDCKRWT